MGELADTLNNIIGGGRGARSAKQLVRKVASYEERILAAEYSDIDDVAGLQKNLV